jgi:hypothetical protein
VVEFLEVEGIFFPVKPPSDLYSGFGKYFGKCCSPRACTNYTDGIHAGLCKKKRLNLSLNSVQIKEDFPCQASLHGKIRKPERDQFGKFLSAFQHIFVFFKMIPMHFSIAGFFELTEKMHENFGSSSIEVF